MVSRLETVCQERTLPGRCKSTPGREYLRWLRRACKALHRLALRSLPVALAIAGNAQSSSKLVEDGEFHVEPFDFAVTSDRLYIVGSRKQAGTVFDRKLGIDSHGTFALDVRTRAGKLVSTVDLVSKLAISRPALAYPMMAGVIDNGRGLTIFIGGQAPIIAKTGYDGAIERHRDLVGSPNYAGWHLTGLERYQDAIVATFNNGLLVLNNELDVVADWQPSRGSVVDARAAEGLLWILESASPARQARGNEKSAGALVALALAGGTFVERERIEMPVDVPPFARILRWSDETLVLLPAHPAMRRCSYRFDRADDAAMECGVLDLGDAPDGVTAAALWLRTLKLGEAGYALAIASGCGVWSRSFDRLHRPAGQLRFPDTPPERADTNAGTALDLILKTYKSDHYALLSIVDSPGPTITETATHLVRVAEMPQSLQTAQWERDCPRWNNASFFASASAAEVRACLRAGAEPNGGGHCRTTQRPLAQAALLATPDVVAALLDAGANPRSPGRWGVTALHQAVASPKHDAAKAVEILTLLLRAGADVNVQSDDGRTPLHHAVEHNRSREVIVGLLEAGANPQVRDGDGKTPWDYARANDALRGTEVLQQLAR